MAKKIILHVVSGFLGSGKTTFIQSMLAELAQRNQTRRDPEKIVYVVNEFGKAGIDAAILSEAKVPSYELADGCICCSLKAEFALALQQIITEHQPDRIIFEPSGLFILSELVQALSGEQFTDQLQIGSIVTLIDARYHRNQRQSTFSPVLANQTLLSDLLVVSKLPDDPEASMNTLIDLQLAYPNQTILSKDAWDFSAEDWQAVLDQSPRSLHQFRFNTTRKLVTHNLFGTRHQANLASVTFEMTEKCGDDRVKINNLLKSLTSGIYGEIIRIKGFLRCQNQNWLVQSVQEHIDWHPVETVETYCLVVIGLDLQTEKIAGIFGNR